MGVLAIGLVLPGGWLALHHPLSAPAMLAAMGVLLLAAMRVPLLALVLLLAMLPAASLAPWSGWMLVEEFDLLALALLGGAYVGCAIGRASTGPGARVAPGGALAAPSALWWMLLTLFMAAGAISVNRGLLDAGAWGPDGFRWGWWQGWHEPMNTLRLAKGVLLAALAVPLWQVLQATEPVRAPRAAAAGAIAGLAVTAALATWERWAWPGLANFTADYRSTALFWETHVGGAALDGFLAVTWPFAFWACLRTRAWGTWVMVMVLLGVVAYAVLTTFSRGLYLAVAVSALVLLLMHWKMTAHSDRMPWRHIAWFAAAALVFAAAAFVVFRGSGYRGLLALWLYAGLGLVAARPVRQLDLLALIGGVAAGAVAVWAALQLPIAAKAPYLLFATSVCLVSGLRAVLERVGADTTGSARLRAAWWATWAILGCSAAGVGIHWGETSARWNAAWAAALVGVAVVAGAMRKGPGPGIADMGARLRIGLFAAMGLAGMVAASVLGGAYLTGRVSTTERDMAGRMAHWERALSLLSGSSDQWWGKGVGRFPANFAFSGVATDQVGDYRWLANGAGERSLLLTGGKHTLGWGEMFRLSQRVGLPTAPVIVSLRAKSAQPVKLHVEICRKHLLYDMGCLLAKTPLVVAGTSPDSGAWWSGSVVLQGAPIGAPAVFSIAVDTRRGVVEIDDLRVLDASGADLLRNGDFSNGLAYWLPSSDKLHLPWHAKNIWIHLLVEQGWAGVIGFGLLLALALPRLAFGAARYNPLGPPLLAGLLGFLIVGLFDSLLDIPRLSFTAFMMLGMAATLEGRVGLAPH